MAAANAAQSIHGSKIISMFDVNEPDVDRTFWRIRGNQGQSLFGRFKNMGLISPVSQNQVKQYEEDWIHQTIHVGTGGITSAGSNNYTFLLSTAAATNDFLETNTTAPYSTAGQYINPVKEFDIIQLPFEEGTLLVTGTSGTGNSITVTCRLIQGALTTASYPAGTELSVFTNAFAEGSDVGTGAVQKPLVDYGYSQIIKTPFTVTGSQLVTSTWLKKYSSGEGIDAYYSVGLKNMEYEQNLAISNALIFGRLTTAANAYVDTAAGNEPIQTTEGIEAYIIRKGINLPYTSGTFSPAIFDSIDALLDAEMAPSYMSGNLGITLDNEKDNALKAYFQGNNTDYTTKLVVKDVFGGDEGRAMAVNFSCLKKGERTYCFSRMPEFSMKKVAGATGYKYPSMGLFWPLADKPDPKNPGQALPYFGMGYRALNGYSRMAELITTAGAGVGDKVIHADKVKYSMRSDIMARHVGGNHMVRLYTS